ncbi:helix-turn-helix transcriptional regulator [Streptomyces sp. NPDC046977]|uniref:helix-turn-helix domain-containing protein n=1 Tax=Streptomyces sp. NPDC046977 TaxID=3154703 RepID=UPI0034059BDE
MPETLDAAARRLAVHLRRMKDRSGLSVPALAARTAQSTEAWEQFLNGVRVPPRDAVEVLGQLSGADYQRLVALWELADRGVTDTMTGFRYSDPLDPLAPVEGMPRHAARRRRRALLVGFGMLAGAFGLLLVAGIATDGSMRAQAPLSAHPRGAAAGGGAPSAGAHGSPAARPGRATSAPTGSPARPGAPRTGAGAVTPDGGTPAAPVDDVSEHTEGGHDPAAGGAGGAGDTGGSGGTGSSGGTDSSGGTGSSGGHGTTAPGSGATTQPPATTAPPAPTPTPTSAAPSPTRGHGLCLGLIVLGICIG